MTTNNLSFKLRFKGGQGSGDFGHKGRPGQVGGSSSGSVSSYINDDDIGGPEDKTWSVSSRGVNDSSRLLYDRSRRFREPVKLGEVYRDGMKGWIAKARDKVVNSSDKTGYFSSRRDAMNAVNNALSSDNNKSKRSVSEIKTKVEQRARALGYSTIKFTKTDKGLQINIARPGRKLQKSNMFISDSGEILDKNGKKVMGWQDI